MFSLSIMTSDAFLELNPRDQILYVQLCLHADDDGVVEASKVLRMIKARTDSVSRLCHQRITSVLRASPLLIHITHWLDHNLIRPDRKVDSKYKDLLLQTIDNIKITEARQRKDRIKKEIEYECLGRPMDDEWTQYGQYSVGVGKDLNYEQESNSQPQDNEKPYHTIAHRQADERESLIQKKREEEKKREVGFDEFWSLYPRLVGKKRAFAKWKAKECYKVKDEIIQDLRGRHAFDRSADPYFWRGVEKQFIPHPEVYLNGERWDDELPQELAEKVLTAIGGN
jgi:hypothetical protein